MIGKPSYNGSPSLSSMSSCLVNCPLFILSIAMFLAASVVVMHLISSITPIQVTGHKIFRNLPQNFLSMNYYDTKYTQDGVGIPHERNYRRI